MSSLRIYKLREKLTCHFDHSANRFRRVVGEKKLWKPSNR